MVPNLSDNKAPDGGVGSGGGLFVTTRGAGAPVLLLHGLFGMGSNLGALARALEPRYEVHQIDLPNHGRSFWRSPMGVEEMATAILQYIEQSLDGRSPYIVGHSLGGKVAMQLALSAPERIAGLIIADIAPVSYSASHQSVFAAITAVAAQPPASRQEAATRMREHIKEEGVLQFLLLSLRRDDTGDASKGYRWLFNVEGLQDSYESMRQPPTGESFGGPTLSIYGALSSYVGEKGEVATRQFFPNVEFAVIEGAGHWLHAEKAEEFNRIVVGFIDRAEQGSAQPNVAQA